MPPESGEFKLCSTGAFRDSGVGVGAGLGNFLKRWVQVRWDSAIKKLLKLFLQYIFNILLSILFHIIQTYTKLRVIVDYN